MFLYMKELNVLDKHYTSKLNIHSLVNIHVFTDGALHLFRCLGGIIIILSLVYFYFIFTFITNGYKYIFSKY